MGANPQGNITVENFFKNTFVSVDLELFREYHQDVLAKCNSNTLLGNKMILILVKASELIEMLTNVHSVAKARIWQAAFAQCYAMFPHQRQNDEDKEKKPD